MDLNRIKLLQKEELLQKLNQNGFPEVARILNDKEVNGQKFIELKEFEIFKWKLNPSEKKLLWDCIKRIKNTPSVLMIRDHPTIPKKPTSIKGRSINDESCKVFKGKLQDILGGGDTSVASTYTITKIEKNNKPPAITQDQNKIKETTSGTQRKIHSNISKDVVPVSSKTKPLPPTPPPSPPPRNNNSKITDVIKKPSQPFPKKNENIVSTDEGYLHMHAPNKRAKELPTETDNGDDYLTPLDIQPESHITKNNSSERPNERGHFGFTTKIDKKTFDNDDTTYELSPSFEENNIERPANNSSKNKDTNVNVIHRKLSLEITDTFQSEEVYEQFPSQEEINTKVHKPFIEDNKPAQSEPIFSFLTSKLNIFKNRNKLKHTYENYNIMGERHALGAMPKETRPLPKIPSSPKVNLRFRQPIPPPRDLSEDPHAQDNYVELTNLEKPSFSQKNIDSNEELEIYENTNTVKTEQSTEEGDIYENTSKAEDLEEEDLIYENTSKTETLDEEEQIYENTAENEERNRTNRNERSPSSKKNSKSSTDPKPWRNNLSRASYNPLNQDKNIVDLASLLQMELKKREQMRLNQQQINDDASATDSEFSDDFEELPIYGNISGDNENKPSSSATKHFVQQAPVIPNPVIADIDRTEDGLVNKNRKKLPIYKTVLPEIPKNINSPSKGNDNKKDESYKTPPLPNKIINEKPESVHKNNKSDDSFKVPVSHTKDINEGLSSNPLPFNRKKREELPKIPSASTQNVNNTRKKDTRARQSPTNKPMYLNYEHHLLKQDDKENENQQEQTVIMDNANNIFNINSDPFYRETDREGAKLLLSNVENGTFLFRPSPTHFLVLTVKHNNRIHNFGIERTSDSKLRLITEQDMEPPTFSTLREFVAYFKEEPVTFTKRGQLMEIYLKTTLAADTF